jgi:LEA14-like dessication related protein
MNLKKLFIPAVLVTGVVLLAKKAGSTIVSGKNLNIKLKTLNIPKKYVIMSIYNPYNGEVVVDNINSDLIFNNNAIATFNTTEQSVIKPNSQMDLKIPFKINSFDAFGVLVDVLKLGKDQIKEYFKKGNLTAKGNINSNGILIGFETKII